MHTGTNLAGYRDAGIALGGGAGMDERTFRLLQRAVLCSLLLHALVLLWLSYLSEGGRILAPSPPPMTARLAKPKPPPEPPKLEPLPRLPSVRNAPVAKPQPVAQPAPAAPTPVLSVERSNQAAEPALVLPPAPAQPVARVEVQPAPPAASGPDPGSVARFRLELMDIARRYKRYPRIAQDNNWEGRVELRIAFAENGTIAALTVKKGTGRAVLDEEAQAMIRAAQPQATIPPALRGKAFTLDIPVDFFLRDDAR